METVGVYLSAQFERYQNQDVAVVKTWDEKLPDRKKSQKKMSDCVILFLSYFRFVVHIYTYLMFFPKSSDTISSGSLLVWHFSFSPSLSPGRYQGVVVVTLALSVSQSVSQSDSVVDWTDGRQQLNPLTPSEIRKAKEGKETDATLTFDHTKCHRSDHPYA